MVLLCSMSPHRASARRTALLLHGSLACMPQSGAQPHAGVARGRPARTAAAEGAGSGGDAQQSTRAFSAAPQKAFLLVIGAQMRVSPLLTITDMHLLE